MKFKIFISLILLLSCSVSEAQYDIYKGVVKVEGAQDFDYEIYLSFAGKVISGYSITDVGGRNETKSNISGVIKDNGNYLIKENRILMTKSSQALSDFCFIVTELNIKPNYVLQGSFSGYTSSNDHCAEGEIYLKKYNIANTQKTIVQTNTEVSTPKINDEKLKFDLIDGTQTVDLIINSDKVEIYVFDNGFVDGDVIDVFLDGSPVLENFEITKEKKRIQLLMRNNTTLRVVAKNSGKSPPNTAFILVMTNEVPLKSYQTKLKEQEAFTLNLLVK